MKPVCLNLEACNGLGDLICSTPTIKKLSDYYQSKITVLSKFPELFKLNPFVEKSYKISSVDIKYFNENYIMHNSFYNVGKKNESGIEYKHNMIDIRQFHAIHLGFMLGKDDMECFYKPTHDFKIEVPRKYVLIHPVQTWITRTWDAKNWMELTRLLNESGVSVISIGKDSAETGFFNVDKPVFNFEIKLGKNLMNKTNISECWHLINQSAAFVTMDSGLLHLAGTTDAHIIHLGSHLKAEFRIPYRNGSQGVYKYDYVRGGCGLECGSDAKHGIKEWGNVQGVAPLIKCLENKPTFECHPSTLQVYQRIMEII
jgi:ADP-heptose:LPS heptosyltransferase